MLIKYFIESIDNDILAKECYHFAEKYPEKHEYVSNRNTNGIQLHKIDGYVKPHHELYKLEKKMHELVPEAVQTQMWININPPGAYNILHDHISKHCIRSATYYVKVNELSGDFVYKDDQNYQQYITPQPGMGLVFETHVKHAVEPNLSNQDRISIAFNFSKIELINYY